ncbi:hypothetical protein ACFU5O_01615 [Streptomyces sp. NPDC057445]|uniref:hypothetical protein n=1 Tax=Streptomyces sp. NPDC057445 TaxID=3346136 RepID=UPI0036C414D3
MVDAETGQLVEQAAPYLTAAAGAYGVAVLTRAESAAADATVNLGRRILQAVWRRRDEAGRAALEAAVAEVAEEPQDPDTAAVLRRHLKRALRDDPELRAELAVLLPAGEGAVTASGERSIAARTITTAITGDNATIRP